MQPLTVAFKTVGCRLNQAETARLAGIFASAGYRVTPFGEPADVVVIHGCTVTARAEKDSFRLARAARRAQPAAFIVLCGCVVEAGGDQVRGVSGADLVVGQAEKFNLPDRLIACGFKPRAAGQPGAGLPQFETTRAIVKIQDGCDFRCAYCIVPRARGPGRSRPPAEIVDEITRLAENGYREMVLTGANIGCYTWEGKTLVDLLGRLESLALPIRLRLSSIEITTVAKAVVDFMAQSQILCRFLHLPLQSGDDRILRAMGRHYTTAQFRKQVDYAVDKLGWLGLGTDVLTGFPGEDVAAAAATEAFLREMSFNNLHVFRYSRRPGTPAAAMPGQVPATEQQKRAASLLALGREQRQAFARQWVGREVAVLIEALEPDGGGRGWTGEYLPARIHGPQLAVNNLVRFVPQAAAGDVLVGRMAGSPGHNGHCSRTSGNGIFRGL